MVLETFGLRQTRYVTEGKSVGGKAPSAPYSSVPNKRLVISNNIEPSLIELPFTLIPSMVSIGRVMLGFW